jgi:uncharacterized protein YbbK (DUF523 family)
MNILISACLMGVNCRYDGSSKTVNELDLLMQKYNLIPICPEQLGGLTTPREPSEIKDGRVISKSGRDVTEQFQKGAQEALSLAKRFHCTIAILKERSPSCGSNQRYDGSFSGTLQPGDGLTAALLKQNNIQVLGENEISSLLQ